MEAKEKYIIDLPKIQGIPLHFFCDKIEEEFICTACQSVLRNAKQASCGCRFCNFCIPNETTCPSCKDQFNKDEITDDFYARRRLRKKKMSCLNKHNGCVATFEYKDLDDHLKNCDFAIVNCIHFKSGCRTKIFRNHLTKHLEKECEFRLVTCQYCERKISFKDLKDHSCENKPVDCPNKCNSAAMASEELQNHLINDCPLALVPCEFEKICCNMKVCRKDLEVHQQEYMANHISIIPKKFEEQNLINVKLLRENADLVSKCALLSNKYQDVSAENELLKNKMQAMEIQMADLREWVKVMFKETQKSLSKTIQPITEQIAILSEEQKDQAIAVQELQNMKARNGRERGNELAADRRDNGGLETHVTLMKVELSEVKTRLACLEETSYDGTLFWRIPDIEKSVREAVSGKTTSLYSQPFYTSRFGYKMCLRLYLNGDGMGRNTHVSLFFVIMRSNYDSLLPWPFKQKVTFILLDQETGQRSMSDSFLPDGNSSSFQMPKRHREMNIASGCPLFVSKCILRDPTYVKQDTMYIKAIVDPLPIW
ncbi:TNF receptor-associated factor 3-like isoform X1 [Anneissia japonica]|uniref:TNF receptor-associated factor 3-like isoform X1 n=1 Tax=Anneissia japonica TaxID=1529436 RepID=UPI0014254D41|nr:TNF receptor-associated factor 3-like isoform X1 [Anneissia japonica]